jgi:hypothetical protein
MVNKVAVAGFQVAHAGACPVRCRPDSGDATHALVDPCQRDRDVAADRETAGDHTAARHVVVGGDPVQHPHRVQGALVDRRPYVAPERPDESISQVRGRFGKAFAVLPWIDTDGEETGAGKSFEHGEHGVFRASKERKPNPLVRVLPHRRISVRRDWMILSVGASGWLRPPSQQPGHAIS